MGHNSADEGRPNVKTLLVALIVIGFWADVSQTRVVEAAPSFEAIRPSARNTVFWHEDMESGAAGWYSVDEGYSVDEIKFHVDAYYAYPDGTPPDYSYWCGELNPDFISGDGYGNSWDQRLDLPQIDLTGAVYPILTFCYRHDSEPDFDFTWVQAESLGEYVDLNQGYTGVSSGWQCTGAYGYVLLPYGNPLRVRFRFVSDAEWSDEDWLYDSDGGAFHCDEIEVYDYFTGSQYFYDDVEDGVGLCTPSVPNVHYAGDWWNVVYDYCSSHSPPHSWWCGDFADTTHVPAFLRNTLYSPVVDIRGAATCTLRFALHAEIPLDGQDYWIESASTDGGMGWHSLGSYWGDFGGCSGWAVHGLQGVDLGPYLPGTGFFQFRLTLATDGNGCGPGIAGGAGINLDDVRLEGVQVSAVMCRSWGEIKALFR
jgi:hypothetical protein